MEGKRDLRGMALSPFCGFIPNTVHFCPVSQTNRSYDTYKQRTLSSCGSCGYRET